MKTTQEKQFEEPKEYRLINCQTCKANISFQYHHSLGFCNIRKDIYICPRCHQVETYYPERKGEEFDI